MEVKQRKHQIVIADAQLVVSETTCNTDAKFAISAANIGLNDETFRFQVFNEELEINKISTELELDESKDFVTYMPVPMPSSAEDATYVFTVNTVYEGYESSTSMPVRFNGCFAPTVREEVVLPQAVTTENISELNVPNNTTILVILNILAGLLAVWLIVNIYRRQNKSTGGEYWKNDSRKGYC